MAVKISKLMPEKTRVVHDTRPLDYLYDSTFVVTSQRDYQRVVAKSFQTEAEFQKCPILPSMFSDGYPRTEMLLKRVDRVPPWIDKSWEFRQMLYKNRNSKSLDIGGADRYRFFRRPIAPFLQVRRTTVQFDRLQMERFQGYVKENGTLQSVQNRSTQTDYRESETQTIPWAPPILNHCESTPEILTLANLSYGHGLPAGMHEVEIIERARKRRAWEKLMPSSADPKCIDLMRHMIDTMERDEWLFREEEIQTINEMRLDLAKKILEEFQKKETDKLNDRLDRYWSSKQEEKKKKIEKIRNTRNRELRKLALRHKNISLKYHEANVVEEHRDHRSELYGPQMRFGEHPKRRHEVINVRSRFLTNIKGLEILETMPSLEEPDHLTTVPLRKGYELCIRETRWTEAVLKQLHQDLRDIRTRKFESAGPIRLVRRLPKPQAPVETPGIEGIADEEEEVYQSAILLQKIIKGRAVQTLMCKGRRKYQELIEEMKSTTALQHADFVRIAHEREYEETLQREQMVQQRQEARIKEIMGYLEGQTLSSMLDFLSKELCRLQDERRIHAFALLAERQRNRREAAEAGRRQAEERRRREHDEMFKQLLKAHQDTVDIFLEDLVMESMDWVSESEARHQVQELARKIDKAAEEFQLRQNDLEQEELVADLIHNFVVPEVQKQIIRKQIKEKQAKYLQEAHACIYDEVDRLPPIEKHEERTSIEGSDSVQEDEALQSAQDILIQTPKLETSKGTPEIEGEMEQEQEQEDEQGDDEQGDDKQGGDKQGDDKQGEDKQGEDKQGQKEEDEEEEEDEIKENKSLDSSQSSVIDGIAWDELTKRATITEEQESEQQSLIINPKISISDKEFQEKLQRKHKIDFSITEEISETKEETSTKPSKNLKSRPRIGFKTSTEEIN